MPASDLVRPRRSLTTAGRKVKYSVLSGLWPLFRRTRLPAVSARIRRVHRTNRRVFRTQPKLANFP